MPTTRPDHGGATSVGDALRRNPQAFLWHVGCNVCLLPKALAVPLTPHLAPEDFADRVVIEA